MTFKLAYLNTWKTSQIQIQIQTQIRLIPVISKNPYQMQANSIMQCMPTMGEKSSIVRIWISIPQTTRSVFSSDKTNKYTLTIQKKTHCLGMNYYVNFLGGIGSNGFHIKWIFGTQNNWKNQNPGGRFGATS